ncbi:ABC transporter substrate-binding protein [Sporosalibacterium faouarense]|uniref:ABC transporter substrate-binding protein n=1 Tax=Sporosalibacterium faouarense TaxID=516123 RepID=UPI001A9C46CA|nr:extracellular solute-binding protein [Sporosalibacterium faouarense]
MLRKTGFLIKSILSMILIMFIIAWPVYNIFIHKADVEDMNDKSKEQWRGVITIWDYPRLNVETGSRYGWITEKIKRFEKENPGVYIKLEPIDWSTGPIKLEVGLKTGRLPDIAPIGNDFVFMEEEVLEPLNPYFSKEELSKFKYQALKAVSHDDKIWGIPTMMSTYAMFINLELFRQNGVEPPTDGNWTYEEFVEKMKKLTYDSDNDEVIDHYGITSFIQPNYYNVWGIILSDGGELIDENGNYSFYGEKAISGVEKLVSLNQEYKVTPENFGTIDENKAWEMFYKDETVAVYPTGTWAVRVLENQYRKGEGFEFAVVNYPIGDKKVPTSLNSNVASYGIFKQEDEGKRQMCVKLLKFLVQDKYQRELESLGMFPTKNNIKNMYSENINMKKFEDALAYTQVVPRHRKWKDIDRILQSQIRMAVIGQKSSQEAIEEARNQIEQLLRQ